MTAAPPAVDGDLDPDIQAFDEVCRRLGGFNEDVDTEWIDGYLTALAATWRVIDVDEWWPRLAGDAGSRAFADPEDHAQATRALSERLAALRKALNPDALIDEPDAMRLAPLMQVWDADTREQVVREGLATAEEAATLHTGARWAEGFFTAVADFEADWPQPAAGTKVQTASADADLQELFNGLMQTVAALAWDPQSPEYHAFAQGGWKDGNPTRDEHIDEACFAVQDLRVYWLDHAPKHKPRQVAQEPGRNDPCPCGSGKKYKRCHGAA
jgi:uncharacterized protein